MVGGWELAHDAMYDVRRDTPRFNYNYQKCLLRKCIVLNTVLLLLLLCPCNLNIVFGLANDSRFLLSILHSTSKVVSHLIILF